MLGRVWLLGPHKIYPFSFPTAVAWRAGRARLGSAQLGSARLAEITLCLCTDPLPRTRHRQDCTLLPGTGRTPVHID